MVSEFYKKSMKWFKNEKIILVFLFVLTLSISCWCLVYNPAPWFDEGIYHQVVKTIANDHGIGVQLAPGRVSDAALISVGYPAFYPAVASFFIFGDSIIVLRAVAILFLFGFLIAFYILARQLFGVKHALISLFFLIIFSPLYGNGKNFPDYLSATIHQ